jgi:hypothetical protein
MKHLAIKDLIVAKSNSKTEHELVFEALIKTLIENSAESYRVRVREGKKEVRK